MTKVPLMFHVHALHFCNIHNSLSVVSANQYLYKLEERLMSVIIKGFLELPSVGWLTVCKLHFPHIKQDIFNHSWHSWAEVCMIGRKQSSTTLHVWMLASPSCTLTLGPVWFCQALSSRGAFVQILKVH